MITKLNENTDELELIPETTLDLFHLGKIPERDMSSMSWGNKKDLSSFKVAINIEQVVNRMIHGEFDPD